MHHVFLAYKHFLLYTNGRKQFSAYTYANGMPDNATDTTIQKLPILETEDRHAKLTCAVRWLIENIIFDCFEQDRSMWDLLIGATIFLVDKRLYEGSPYVVKVKKESDAHNRARNTRRTRAWTLATHKMWEKARTSFFNDDDQGNGSIIFHSILREFWMTGTIYHPTQEVLTFGEVGRHKFVQRPECSKEAVRSFAHWVGLRGAFSWAIENNAIPFSKFLVDEGKMFSSLMFPMGADHYDFCYTLMSILAYCPELSLLVEEIPPSLNLFLASYYEIVKEITHYHVCTPTLFGEQRQLAPSIDEDIADLCACLYYAIELRENWHIATKFHFPCANDTVTKTQYKMFWDFLQAAHKFNSLVYVFPLAGDLSKHASFTQAFISADRKHNPRYSADSFNPRFQRSSVATYSLQGLVADAAPSEARKQPNRRQRRAQQKATKKGR
ncbi:hypothetical protein TRVA0_005S02080 [Trichomonascus vanleenenianus]|uniref:uncharacterized protein n=1 Tax=Trichomonascus vanleenenianus TaxID=2268995 RepID=UPI003ECA175D